MNVSFLAFLSMALSFSTVSCSDDSSYPDVDGQDPTMKMASEHIQTAAGRSISLKGTLEDKDGIASINLKCADLNLNKTIDLIEIYGEPKVSYDLDYKFQIQKDEIGESFTVTVTTTDVGGRSVSQDVLVTMDGDFESPVFIVAPGSEVAVLLKSETRFALTLNISDDRALDYVTVQIPSISGYEPKRIEANGQKSIEFKDKIILPSVLKVYDIVMTAYDKSGNSTIKTTTLTVSELQDFSKMYLADVATVEELNSDVFGVPMLIKHTGAYEYEAEYYNQKAGTNIFFIPQKTDFAPICFGLDPEDSNRLTDDPETAKPIVLSQAGVYYKVKFNTMNSTYSISTLSVANAIDPAPHEFNSISLDTWDNGGSWLQKFYFGYMTSNPREVATFVQNPTNPHLYSLPDPLVLEAGQKMNFVIHNWHSDGWWNYCTWRVDNSDAPETFDYYGNKKNPAWTEPNGKDNWAKPVVQKSGSYKLWFDAHLGRGKLVPVK